MGVYSMPFLIDDYQRSKGVKSNIFYEISKNRNFYCIFSQSHREGSIGVQNMEVGRAGKKGYNRHDISMNTETYGDNKMTKQTNQLVVSDGTDVYTNI